METDISFGTWVRRRRRALDLTQEALARRVGCARITIQKLEAGERRPSREFAALLAERLAVPPAERDAFLRAARSDLATPQLDEPTRPAATSAALRPRAPGARPTAAAGNLPVWPTLPVAPTPFVGRSEELHTLTRLLSAPDVRLLTIVAPGGMGKTRLAVAALERARVDGAFPDGVAVADLAPLTMPEHLDTTLAAALDLPLARSVSPTRTPRQQLLDYLREKRLLLLLDNCEHLLDGVAELTSAILAEAPSLTLLATSRERLGLRAEHLFPLDGMAAEADSAALFAATAQVVRSDFILDEHARPLVAAICSQVGGMPLAIELAAGWADTLSLAEIATELARSDELLATQARDMAERHRSVRSVCDTTWGHLTPEERSIFALAAVFCGGGTRKALQAVTGATLPQLHSLVGKALVRYNPQHEHYTMHEVLRQYAAERLADDPDAEAEARERHAAYYLTALAEHGPALQGAGQVQALEEIGRDVENARAAWAWAIAAGRGELLHEAAHAFGLFCEWQGRYAEGLEAFTAVSERLAAQPEAIQAHILALSWQSAFARLLGDQPAAQQAVDAALNALDDPARIRPPTDAARAFALLQQARLSERNDTVAAQQAYAQSLILAQITDDQWLAAAAFAGLGGVMLERADFGPAEAYWQESLQISRQLGAPLGIAIALAALSTIARYQGRIAENVQLAQESYDIFVRLGNRAMIAYGSLYLARALLWYGDFPRTEVLLCTAVTSFHELGDQTGLVDALYQRGGLSLILGHYDEAEADIRMVLAHAARLNDRESEGFCRWFLACILLCRGAYDDAERAVYQAITLLEQNQQMEWVGRAYSSAAHIERTRARPARAWAWVAAGLRLGLKHRSYMSILFTLRSAALLIADTGAVERATELGALARPLMYGKWAEDLYYTQLDALAATLSRDVAAAAIERGQQRDPWATAAELLAEIEAAGWGGLRTFPDPYSEVQKA